jgi:hypothetical protein
MDHLQAVAISQSSENLLEVAVGPEMEDDSDSECTINGSAIIIWVDRILMGEFIL